jgi:hypothetical protein
MLRQWPSLGNSLGTYRIGAYTLGEVRDLIQNRAWQLGLGADATMYSKPASLELAYGKTSGLIPDYFCGCGRDAPSSNITGIEKTVLLRRIPP